MRDTTLRCRNCRDGIPFRYVPVSLQTDAGTDSRLHFLPRWSSPFCSIANHSRLSCRPHRPPSRRNPSGVCTQKIMMVRHEAECCYEAVAKRVLFGTESSIYISHYRSVAVPYAMPPGRFLSGLSLKESNAKKSINAPGLLWRSRIAPRGPTVTSQVAFVVVMPTESTAGAFNQFPPSWNEAPQLRY